MGTIIIKNMTTLTDFAAVMRVGLYMADAIELVEEGGFQFEKDKTVAGKCVIAIIEKEE